MAAVQPGGAVEIDLTRWPLSYERRPVPFAPGYWADTNGDVWFESHARLTVGQVEDLKRRRSEGERMHDLAVEFGISYQTAYNYVNERFRPRELRKLKPGKMRNGYLQVGIWRVGDQTNTCVHRIVAEAFHGPLPPGHCTRHLDGDKTNNRPFNLVYGTYSENSADALRHGAIKIGAESVRAKLTDDDVRAIKRGLAAGVSGPQLARRFGVGNSTIYRIKNGLSWTHVEVTP